MGERPAETPMRGYQKPMLRREEREIYEQAKQREGKVWKKSHNILVGFQKRYFKVLASGTYLAYYNQMPVSGKDLPKPNGVFEIVLMQSIKIKEPR